MMPKYKEIICPLHSGGFTLVEVLIAMVVATVGLLAMAMMQGNSIQGNSYASQFTQATALAQEKLEELNCAPLLGSDSPLQTGITDEDTLETIDTFKGAGGVNYTRSWNVAANTTFSRIVTVTVAWTNNQVGPTPNHSVQFSNVTRGDQY